MNREHRCAISEVYREDVCVHRDRCSDDSDVGFERLNRMCDSDARQALFGRRKEEKLQKCAPGNAIKAMCFEFIELINLIDKTKNNPNYQGH